MGESLSSLPGADRLQGLQAAWLDRGGRLEGLSGRQGQKIVGELWPQSEESEKREGEFKEGSRPVVFAHAYNTRTGAGSLRVPLYRHFPAVRRGGGNRSRRHSVTPAMRNIRRAAMLTAYSSAVTCGTADKGRCRSQTHTRSTKLQAKVTPSGRRRHQTTFVGNEAGSSPICQERG